MMNKRAKSDSIPVDLIPEILSRLPAKAVARFRCVSKPWESIICRRDFNELFRTMSSSKPRLLVGVVKDGDWSFFSSPQPQNHYGKSSLVVAADFHTKFSEDRRECSFSYASGLFYFSYMRTSKEYEERVICNPSTGQYAILPPDLRTTYYNRGGFLGFDPIGNQFKVLVMNRRVDDGLVYHILTLGTEKNKWREIICPSFYFGPSSSGICINGFLYYIAIKKLCCFDIRYEKIKFLAAYPDGIEWFHDLINYKGKLCGSKLEYGRYGGFPIKLRMWVLEDVEKEEWSEYAYILSAENKAVYVNMDLSVVGMTASGEIVLAKKRAHKPFYVFYFNPETNILSSVEIQSVREEEERFRNHRVYCFVDHVVDLNFDVMKTPYAAPSMRPPEQSTSTLSREDHQVRTVAHLDVIQTPYAAPSMRPPEQSTSTLSREDRQVRTVAHLEQDRHTFESVNRFDVLYLLEDD